jgi:hypothetical protein
MVYRPAALSVSGSSRTCWLGTAAFTDGKSDRDASANLIDNDVGVTSYRNTMADKALHS